MSNNIKKKTCSICGKIKPLTSFYSRIKISKDKKKIVYYNPECKECSKVRSELWSINNEKRRKEIKKRYDDKPNRKMVAAENSREQRRKGRYLEWQRDNKIKMKIYNINRKAIRKSLPNSLTESDIKNILKTFGNKCSITNSTDIDLDHFIPISWGHGGSYVGNVIPLDFKMNRSKTNKNPFEWVKGIKIDLIKWNMLIEYLSKENGLTTGEFEKYVYWCERNKRKTKDIIKCKTEQSIVLWRKSI